MNEIKQMVFHSNPFEKITDFLKDRANLAIISLKIHFTVNMSFCFFKKYTKSSCKFCVGKFVCKR